MAGPRRSHTAPKHAGRDGPGWLSAQRGQVPRKAQDFPKAGAAEGPEGFRGDAKYHEDQIQNKSWNRRAYQSTGTAS